MMTTLVRSRPSLLRSYRRGEEREGESGGRGGEGREGEGMRRGDGGDKRGRVRCREHG